MGKICQDANDDRIFPLTDKDEIYNILKIFNLTNYKDEETGTTIIIPFIKELKIILKMKTYILGKRIKN